MTPHQASAGCWAVAVNAQHSGEACGVNVQLLHSLPTPATMPATGCIEILELLDEGRT